MSAFPRLHNRGSELQELVYGTLECVAGQHAGLQTGARVRSDITSRCPPGSGIVAAPHGVHKTQRNQ